MYKPAQQKIQRWNCAAERERANCLYDTTHHSTSCCNVNVKICLKNKREEREKKEYPN